MSKPTIGGSKWRAAIKEAELSLMDETVAINDLSGLISGWVSKYNISPDDEVRARRMIASLQSSHISATEQVINLKQIGIDSKE